jgi:hypothetical protein
MKRGRPFEPGNHFGRGRPRGSRNKKTLIVRQLLDEHADSILRKAMLTGLQGDSPMLQALLSYILPRPKDTPLKTEVLRTATAKELSQSMDVILKRACDGQITLTQAQQLAALIETRRQLLQTEEFETRLGILEKTSSPT